MERPVLSRVNIGSSLTKDLGVLVLALRHLKPTATSWPARSVRVDLKPTATTWSERGEGEHRSQRRATRRRSILIAPRRVVGGAAPEAQATLQWLRVAAFETRPPVAEFMPRLRGTALLARVPVAELGPWPMGTAHEARFPFVEIGPGLRGNRAGDAGSLRQYCTMKICDRQRRCP